MRQALKLALAAATLPAAVAMTGCDMNAHEGQAHLNRRNADAGVENNFKLEKIANGNFLYIETGAYILTFPAKAVGTKNDLPCLVISQSPNLDSATAGFSCDWATAHGLKP